jgi:predicted RNA polymerase sigma factor
VPALVPHEREEIRAILVDDPNARFASISSSLSRDPSTVSREVARNGGRHRHRAVCAQRSTCRNWSTQCRHPFAEELTTITTIANVPDHQLRRIFRCATPAAPDVAAALSDRWSSSTLVEGVIAFSDATGHSALPRSR